ncbi:hypothetical protein [Streptomyces sp. NPDC004680]|uniref:hypothetical protein n=1 Tax=Streptomyces sp. NPDC004680 TaxID=3154287 RepID=UPI0033AFD0CF
MPGDRAGHLKACFDQPLEFSRYLAAVERLFVEARLTGSRRQEAVAAPVKALAAPAGDSAAR